MKITTSTRSLIGPFALGLAVALPACSAPPNIGLRGSPAVAAPVEPAGFRLSGVTVKWVDEPNVPTTYSYGTTKVNPQAPTEAQAKAAKEDFAAILRIMHDGAVANAMAALARQGVPSGDQQLILLSPSRLYRDASGWGSGIDVRVTVQSANGQSLWSSIVNVDSGLQWLGPKVSKPTDAYAKDFAENLLKVLRQAGMVG